MEFSNGIKGLKQHLDIVDASPRLNYCGWLRNPAQRWLKPDKSWDVYHRFQLGIWISLAHPQ